MRTSTNITVDMTIRNTYGPWVYATQGDCNTRWASVTLLAGGRPWRPTANMEVAVMYRQPGGTKGLYNLLEDDTPAVRVCGNRVEFLLAPQMLTVPGDVRTAIVINNEALDQLTTFPFTVTVKENPLGCDQKAQDYIRLRWLNSKLEEQLKIAKDSGEFDGPKGDPFTYDDFTPEQLAALTGPQGPAGDNSAALAAADAANTAADAANQAASAAQTLAPAVTQLQDDVAAMGKSKISKFYASSMGESTLSDADNGPILNLRIYGQSLQDSTPAPDTPVEIQSVVDPSICVLRKNFWSLGDIVCEKASSAPLNNTPIYIPKGTYVLSFKSNSNNDITHSITFSDKDAAKIVTINVLSSQFYNGGAVTIVFDRDVKYINSWFREIVTFTEIQLEKGELQTDFEPYHAQLCTLPCTLNAIPVSSGGNLTLDGQQYIADYVDIENRKLVQLTNYLDISTIDSPMITELTSVKRVAYRKQKAAKSAKIKTLCSRLEYLASYSADSPHIYADESGVYLFIPVDSELLQAGEYFVLYALKEPIETPLTDAQVEAFRNLYACYPQTNVTVSSEQICGAAVFDYPVSLESGWNYVKAQLGDTRDYIYNMDEQAALAYVNSEYAVALAELEV